MRACGEYTKITKNFFVCLYFLRVLAEGAHAMPEAALRAGGPTDSERRELRGCFSSMLSISSARGVVQHAVHVTHTIPAGPSRTARKLLPGEDLAR